MRFKDELYELLESTMDDEYDDISDEYLAKEIIDNFFKEKGIDYKISIDDMFDSVGCAIMSLSIAWIENNKPQLSVYKIYHG